MPPARPIATSGFLKMSNTGRRNVWAWLIAAVSVVMAISQHTKVAFLKMLVSGIVAVRVSDPPRVPEGRHACSALRGACRQPHAFDIPSGNRDARLEIVVLGFGGGIPARIGADQ
jgi:hypothetical protein